MKISREVLDILRRLGLSKYEANAYVALVGLSTGTATEIANIAGTQKQVHIEHSMD
ncbi:MAG: hypothetical protein J7L47_00610 [Candidatus Odinarchaeota archaeon]|nr:hypothetical protein [Candidatus Odinarchaeota archaeon]